MTNWIAVVDDDMTTLTVAGRILSNNNMRVSAMNSGKAFLSFIKDNKPDLVLVQTDMPEMDGITTVQKLRDYEGKKGLKAIPVIFLMTNDNEEIEKQGKELGVVDFIKKPFAPEVFLNVIWKNILSDKDVKCRNKAETGKVENIQPIDHTAVEMDEKQDLEHLNRTLKEKSDPNSALWVDNKAFASIYRFFARYIESYKVHKDIEQANLTLAFPSVPSVDDRAYAISAMSAMLGGGMSSLLFQEIRERLGLVYSVYDYSSLYEKAGAHCIYLGTNPKNLEKAVRAVKKCVDDFAARGLDDEALYRAKMQVKSGLILGGENSMSIMRAQGRTALIKNEIFDLDERIAIVDNLTKQQINDVIRTIFLTKQIGIGYVGKDPRFDLTEIYR